MLNPFLNYFNNLLNHVLTLASFINTEMLFKLCFTVGNCSWRPSFQPINYRWVARCTEWDVTEVYIRIQWMFAGFGAWGSDVREYSQVCGVRTKYCAMQLRFQYIWTYSNIFISSENDVNFCYCPIAIFSNIFVFKLASYLRVLGTSFAKCF